MWKIIMGLCFGLDSLSQITVSSLIYSNNFGVKKANISSLTGKITNINRMEPYSVQTWNDCLFSELWELWIFELWESIFNFSRYSDFTGYHRFNISSSDIEFTIAYITKWDYDKLRKLNTLVALNSFISEYFVTWFNS